MDGMVLKGLRTNHNINAEHRTPNNKSRLIIKPEITITIPVLSEHKTVPTLIIYQQPNSNRNCVFEVETRKQFQFTVEPSRSKYRQKGNSILSYSNTLDQSQQNPIQTEISRAFVSALPTSSPTMESNVDAFESLFEQ
jgi:hypothetical protein